jgi:TonB family protein
VSRSFRVLLSSLALGFAGPEAWAQEAPEEKAPDETPEKAPEEKAPADAEGPAEGAPAQPVVNPPAIIESPSPVFPEQALADRVHGIVVVELSITAEGAVDRATVGSLTIIPETGEPRAGDGRYGFGPAATEAAQKMRFKPAEYNGVPFAVQINFTYRFSLPPKPEEPEGDATPEPVKEPEINYQGALVERGTRSVVAGATVTVYRGSGEDLEGFEATSDAKGEFRFYDLPEGKWQVRIEREGYIPVKTNEELSPEEVVEGRYWIEKGSYNEYDLTIEAERPRKEVNRRSLSTGDLSGIAGTLSDDPVLVVENLPGVARSGPIGGGEIIVRGSGPNDTGVFVNGIRVPLIYHFGGLKSVLPAKAIGGVDFYPGNYSVSYGRAMGGVLDLKLKRLNPDITHGSADISVLDTSLYLETPIGDKAAIAVAGRRSYVDFILEAAIPDDAGLALTTAPRYYDYQILGNYRPKRSHEFRWLGMGSDDLLELLFDDPADTLSPGVATSNNLSAQTAFQRLIADHKYTPSEKISNLARFSLGRDELNFDALGAFFFKLDVYTANIRDNLSYKINENLSLETGFDAQMAQFSGDIKVPPLPAEGQPDGMDGPPDEILEVSIDSDSVVNFAPFVEAQIQLGDLLLVPGLRLDYFGLPDQFSVDPRITARYELPHDVAVKAGAAVVHQPPIFPEINEVFGNPNLELQRALQYSIGVDWQATEDIRGDLTFFYKDMDKLVSPTDALIERDGQMVAARYDNNGVGRVYGAEVFLEHDFNGSFNGWLSYTFSRAERKDSGKADFRLFDFDQTHILAIVGGYELGRNWKIGARMRLVSGSPSTPVVGAVFQNDIDQYSPVYGEVNTNRLPMFQQLDLRVDKTFIYDTWKFAAYLSLLNSTNHTNVEGVTYNFDYTQKGSINGLPILPIIGVKGEW